MPRTLAGLGMAPAARFLRYRALTGWDRVRHALLQAVQMVVAAIAAYAFAQFVLGHPNPYFACTAALIATGFATGPRTRRVIEVAVGCALGVLMGELMLMLFGRGIWQAAVVMFFSILLARFIDRGVILATQLAVQSALVIFLVSPSSVPLSRSLDAVVGGVVALLATLLTPRDPRRDTHREVQSLLGELALVLRDCSQALESNDATTAWHALVRARNCQAQLDSVKAALTQATEVASIAPAYRKHRHELTKLSLAIEHVDFAFRNSRVLARRLTSAINNAAMAESTQHTLSDITSELANSVDELGAGLSERDRGAARIALDESREQFSSIATSLHPKKLGIERIEGQAVVILLRPMVADLMEAAGMSGPDAQRQLPKL